MATDQIHSTEKQQQDTSANVTFDSHWPIASEEFWHASVPAGVQRRYISGDMAGGWKRWRRHVNDRSTARLARELAEKLAGSRKKSAQAIYWAANGSLEATPRLNWLVKLADAKPRRMRLLASESPAAIAAWLESTSDVQHWPVTSDEALEAVAWVRSLPALARVADGESWWQIIERLHQLALSAAEHPTPSADPLTHQLACGELPWSLAAMFPEIEPCRQLAAVAAKSLSSGISELLDGSGVPHSRHLAVFHRLVACWTRCRVLAAADSSKSREARLSEAANDERAPGSWDSDAEQQYFQAVREALRLSRADGTPMLCETAEASLSKGSSWLTGIAAGLADKADKRYRRSIAAIAMERCHEKPGGRRSKRSAKHLPDASIHSEWAELALLQSDWSQRAERLAIAYNNRRVQMELQADRRLLLHGTWEMEISADGRSLEPQGDWSETCWASDADCDYLELEIQLSQRFSVQRQIVLSRREQFLFLADAVLGEVPCDLKYAGRLPLAAEIEAEPAKETRELLLLAKEEPRAAILPLELPEWRVDPRGGSLSACEQRESNRQQPAEEKLTNGAVAKGADGNGAVSHSVPERRAAAPHGAAAIEPAVGQPAAVTLCQSIHGCRLFAPLWIDLSAKRVGNLDRDPLTWRQLTVAEERHILPRDVAVAYRVQAGRRQWVVYRSLAARANRTFLGINLATEFYVGQFDSDGETNSVIEID